MKKMQLIIIILMIIFLFNLFLCCQNDNIKSEITPYIWNVEFYFGIEKDSSDIFHIQFNFNNNNEWNINTPGTFVLLSLKKSKK